MKSVASSSYDVERIPIEPVSEWAANRRGRCRGAGLRQIYVEQTRKGTAGQRIHLFNGRQHSGRRMVEKAVGKRLSEYLYERFFEPLGQGFPIWENCPQGHPIGGGGMFMTLSNMLKIGQVYLMDGKWKGQQLVDPAWIKEATAKQIETPNPGNDIWVCGYGYQFWRNPYEDSYRADGAYGQLTMVLPKKGLIVAVQCPESGDLNKVKPVMHELILSL